MSSEKLTKKQLKSAQFRSKGKRIGADSDAGVIEKLDEEDKKAQESNSDISAINKPVKEKKSKKRDKEKDKVIAEESSATPREEGEESLKPTAAEKKARKEQKRQLREEKEKEAKEGGKADSDEKSKKRKRGVEDKDAKSKGSKKRFTEDGQVEEVEVQEETKKSEENDEEKQEDKRYIVFVGNMSFQSTSDQIAKHFSSHCNETPSVRLLTKKGDPSKLNQLPKSKQKSIAKGKALDPSASTSKGCAFLEFKSASALQKALQFHHTQFQSRNINVELTAGGGGKGDGRKEKIRKKNQDLEAERQKLHEKYVKNTKKEKGEGGEAATKDAPPKKEPSLPQWGPKAAGKKGLGATKIPKWAASGANAVRLSG